MANSAQAFGFVPVRTLDGTGATATVRFAKSAATGDDARIAVGDPVRLVNGTVEKLLTADISAASGTYLGVVANVLNANGRPKDAFSGSGSISTTANTTDLFDVFVQSEIVYRVASDLDAITPTSAARYIGTNANVVFTAATDVDNRLGASTARLTFTGTLSADAPFRVVGVSQTVADTTNTIFEVIGNATVYKNGKA